MLVIISDLHFCDGTASPHNVDPRAFRLLLGEIYRRAAAALPLDPQRREIDLVLLGDIFDLLRTERWFADAEGRRVPLAERPWGRAEALEAHQHDGAVLARASAITDEIIAANGAALALLRGEGLEALVPAGTVVRRLFVPGNHDRLLLHDPEIRSRVLAALGATWGEASGEEGVYRHRLAMRRYGLMARHGHEWDPWNFARFRPGAVAADYDEEDYRPTPIGDVITTELVARLPYELRRRLEVHPTFAGTPELDHVYRRLQLIEDVRPLLASFHWIFYEAERLGGQLGEPQARALGGALCDAIQSVAADFLQLDFYRAWRERHDRLGPDLSDRLHLLLVALSQLPRVDLRDVAPALSLLEPLLRWIDEDLCLRGARREDLKGLGDRGLRFVVYGHTHEPLQQALRRETAADLYLNSGTWRDRQYATTDQRGFVGWQHFSYLLFYGEDEQQFGPPAAPAGGPAYERWMGTRGRS